MSDVVYAISPADKFAAFAVYAQNGKYSYVSKLPTSICHSVRAWLIACAQLKDH